MADLMTSLIAETQLALHTSQEGLGKLAGVSRRTAQRWAKGHTAPVGVRLHMLATAVYPHSRALAERFARHGGTTLVELGLEGPPAPPKPPPPPRPTAIVHPRHLADSIVCAAAETLALAPNVIRPALLVAFERARQMGLTLAEAEAALRELPPAERKTVVAKG